jgi:acyl-coenzyme A thioesterase PaaI-like protein
VSGLDSERRSLIVDRLLRSPVADRLGLELVHAEAGLVRISMPFAQERCMAGSFARSPTLLRLRVRCRASARFR